MSTTLRTHAPGRPPSARAPRVAMSLLASAALFVGGCSVDPEGLADPPVGTPVAHATTPRPQAGSITASPSLQVRRVELLLPQAATLTDAWERHLLLPYGIATTELGVADTHGGSTPPWGPEYGAPAADGSWWILDTHKRRIARYDAEGRFLGAVEVPGEFMDLQFPFVLGDGWFFAAGAPELGVVADTKRAERIPIPQREQARAWSYSDWNTVYSDDGSRIHTLTIVDGIPVWGTADHFRTPAGNPFLVRVDPRDRSVVQVWLPEARPVPVRVDLAVSATDAAGTPVEAGVEVAADGAGRIHLLFYGGVDGNQLAGYTSVTPDGEVAAIEPVRNPFSASDPGSPSHLRAVPGTSKVALTFVDVDGVHIFVRSN